LDWEDASLYDLVLNLEQMSLEEACEVISAASRLKCFASTAETQRKLRHLAKASRVKARLAMDPKTSDLQFEVAAHDGSVSIKGDIVNPHQIKEISRIARTVPDVDHVNVEELELATRF